MTLGNVAALIQSHIHDAFRPQEEAGGGGGGADLLTSHRAGGSGRDRFQRESPGSR